MASETPRRVIWNASNRHHLLVEHSERGLTKEEIDEVLLAPESIKVDDEKHQAMVTVGRTCQGRLLLIAWRATTRGMYPVHARQVSMKFWRCINEDFS